jgi:hypothetical protein
VNCREARKLARVVSKALAKGHRLHANNPRTARLLELVRGAGVDGVHMKTARAVEKSFVAEKKDNAIDVDGAIGATLADLGMNPPPRSTAFS